MIVTGEHRNRGDAAVAGGFHIVCHIADKGGELGIELVSLQYLMNHLPLVLHSGIRCLKMMAPAKGVQLLLKRQCIHRG